MRIRRDHFAIGAFLVFLGALAALSQEKQDKPANPGFEKLKSLVGEWVEAEQPAAEKGEKGEQTEKAEKKDAQPAVVYRVVAAGSVVQETLFPGTPHEMVTMYYMDGPDLVLTHYCAAHNQPHMKAEKAANDRQLIFKFAGGSNIDPAKDGHMHDLTMTFIDADHIRSEWTYYADGKKGDTKTFELARKKR